MTTRSNGPAAGWGWLTNGFSVGFRHPKPLLGGAALLVVACLLPMMFTLPVQLHAMATGVPQSPTTFAWMMAMSMAVGLLLVPLYGGYLQVVDAAERGLPARAIDVLNPYRKGEALRLIGYGLAMLLFYVAVFAIAIVLTGGGVASWYMQLLSAQATHQPPPNLPQGFGMIATLYIVFGLFMMGCYSISLGQVALRQRSVFGAIGDGMAGAVKNVLPLLVFALSLVLAWIVVVIGLLLFALVVGLLAKLIGAWFIMVLVIPLEFALMLTVIAVMFGVMYHLWRDVCGDDTTTDMMAATTA